MDGSNALSIQEEGRACSQKLPGLCYPRSRRGTGESESCHAYQVGEATHYWVRSDQFSGCNAQEQIKTLRDVALVAAEIPIDIAYPLKAPMNTARPSLL